MVIDLRQPDHGSESIYTIIVDISDICIYEVLICINCSVLNLKHGLNISYTAGIPRVGLYIINY